MVLKVKERCGHGLYSLGLSLLACAQAFHFARCRSKIWAEVVSDPTGSAFEVEKNGAANCQFVNGSNSLEQVHVSTPIESTPAQGRLTGATVDRILFFNKLDQTIG